MQKDFSVELKIIQEATDAAKAACDKMIRENPEQWYPCGFSWVLIRPARGRLIQALKHFNIGHTSDGGGYMVHDPSNSSSQWMDAKMAGSIAFAEVLRKHYKNITVTPVQRID